MASLPAFLRCFWRCFYGDDTAAKGRPAPPAGGPGVGHDPAGKGALRPDHYLPCDPDGGIPPGPHGVRLCGLWPGDRHPGPAGADFVRGQGAVRAPVYRLGAHGVPPGAGPVRAAPRLLRHSGAAPGGGIPAPPCCCAGKGSCARIFPGRPTTSAFPP